MAGASELPPSSQIWLCFARPSFTGTVTPIPYIYLFSTAAFTSQWHSGIGTAETVWPTKSKFCLLSLSLQKNFAHPGPALLLHRVWFQAEHLQHGWELVGNAESQLEWISLESQVQWISLQWKNVPRQSVCTAKFEKSCPCRLTAATLSSRFLPCTLGSHSVLILQDFIALPGSERSSPVLIS